MQRLRPIPAPAAGTRLRPSPRFAPLIAAFGSLGSDLESQVRANPYFHELLASGILKELRLGGRVPQAAHQDFALARAVRLVQDHGIDREPEWPSLLRSPLADRRLDDLAAKWRVPPADLRAAVRALRGGDDPARSRAPLDDASYRAAAGATFPVEILEVAAHFVERYGLTQQDFVDLFLRDTPSPELLAARLNADRREVNAVCEAVARLDVLDASASVPVLEPPAPSGLRVLAAVTCAGEQLAIRLLSDDLQRRFHIDRDRARDWIEASPDRRAREAFLEWIRSLNERAGARLRVLTCICSRQRRFIADGDSRRLAPLSQSAVAKETAYHRSVVSRVVNAAAVETPHGVVALTALTPGPGPVVRTIVEREPALSDVGVADRLMHDFGVRLSRRTINYHRHRPTRPRR
jgi:hypothetical protein